jgi:uncharacterized damage-inducible protein DinB
LDPLRELFRHHAWATQALIDHCAGLPPDALQATVPGTAGTIHHTLVHLVAADGRYLSLMTGAPQAVRESAPPPLGELRAHFAEQVRRWDAVLDRLDELDVTIPARGDDWPETPHARNLLLLQAFHHGNDHRTHVCTILGARGLPVPELSGWEYWLVTHRPQ